MTKIADGKIKLAKGWKIRGDNSDKVYSVDDNDPDNDSFEITADTTLEPVWADAVAKLTVGSGDPTYYTSLHEALNAAAKAEGMWTKTVTLLADISKETEGEGINSLTIPAGRTVTLDLNGKTIDLDDYNLITFISVSGDLTLEDNSSAGNGVIKNGAPNIIVHNGGKLTMESGTLTKNEEWGYMGRGVTVESGGEFIMNGGSVTGNTESGVYIEADGQFTMNSGEISGNIGSNEGGGVDVRGTFTMNGGSITGNGSGTGGGVYVGDGGTFAMKDGTISGNEILDGEGSTGNGGGVYVAEGGTFTMSGGKISRNTAKQGGGVYVGDGTFELSGTPEIIGNSADNVYLAGTSKITVTGQLRNEETGKKASIGVKLENGTGVFTDSTDTSLNEIGNFSSDDTRYSVFKNNVGQLYIDKPVPENSSGGLTFFRLSPGIMPRTGFSAGHVPVLSEKPMNLNYKPLNWSLEIPSLSLDAAVVEVPFMEGEYSVTWLGNDAGLLEGSAVPGRGQSVVTGHNHLNQTEPGPFVNLWALNEGDRIFVRDLADNILVFTVYANEKLAETDIDGLNRLIDGDPLSLTLITCEDERPEGGYANRRVITARPLY